MKKSLLLISLTFIAITTFAINVSIPDSSGFMNGESIKIPIITEDVTGQGVYSYMAKITYDPTVISYNGLSVLNTLSISWPSPVVNSSTSGVITLSAYGTAPLAGEGDLLFIKFNVIGQEGDVSPVNFEYFYYNEGTPSTELTNGSVTVGDPVVLPEPPVANAATSVTSNSFEANWTAPSSGSAPETYFLDVAYDISVASPVAGYNNLDVGNVENYSVAGLDSSTDYFYRLRSHNSNGYSGYSNIISLTTLTPPPEPPTATAATSITTNSFEANWIAPTTGSTPEKYYLDLATDNQFMNILSAYNNLDVGNSLSHSIINLSPQTDYYYRLRSYNTQGYSGYSNTIQVQTQEIVQNLNETFIHYQAILRNQEGIPNADTTVVMQFSLLRDVTTGICDYSEKQTITTNQFGLINSQIGSGDLLSGSFENLLWDEYSYYLEVSMINENQADTIVIGTNNLNYTPYAFHSLSTSDTTFNTLNITSGDLHFAQPSAGMILKSPDGTSWKVTIDNSGNLISVQVPGGE